MHYCIVLFYKETCVRTRLLTKKRQTITSTFVSSIIRATYIQDINRKVQCNRASYEADLRIVLETDAEGRNQVMI